MRKEAIKVSAATPWVATEAPVNQDPASDPEPDPVEPEPVAEERPVSEATPTAEEATEPRAWSAPLEPPLFEVPDPGPELEIPDVSPSTEERGGGGPSLSVDTGGNGSASATLIAPERIVVIPEVAPEPELEQGLDRLDAQLAEFRDLLRGAGPDPERDADE
jgi:hypothetical protein